MNNNWEFDYSELYQSTEKQEAQAAQQQAQSSQNAQGSSEAASEMQNAQGAWIDPERQEPIAPNTPPPYSGAPVPQPKKQTGFGRRFAAGVMLVVFCGAVSVGGGYLGSRLGGAGGGTVIYKAADTGITNTGADIQSIGTNTVSQIAAIAGPSVVEVTTENIATNAFFGQYITDGAGSGVIISEDGYIITNHHVVSGASKINVTLSDKTSYEAKLIGTDSKTDIAVLKIDATGLTPAIVGDSDKLSVGEFALAIGNPMGTLGGTVTDGIISALNRDITVGSETMNLMQTNAAVSPGNSGGGLFNERGELIGIVNAKSSGTNTEGLGFAIPINTAIQVAQQLMEVGYVTGRPAMGVTVVSIHDIQTAMQYGVTNFGVYIQSVNEGSAAEKSGLQPGDRFISINDVAINESADITSEISNYAVGDTIEIQVARDRQIVNVTLTLEESQPQQPQQPVAG